MHARTIAAAGALLLLCGGCGGGPSTGFTLSNATVQPNFVCPAGATTSYGLQATVSSHNSTSGTVTVKSASAAMTVAAVSGGWLQKVGYRYDAGNLKFSPDHVAPGAGATLTVTIPSACTDRKTGGQLSYAEYSVVLTFVTSAGTFKIESRNRHRIVA